MTPLIDTRRLTRWYDFQAPFYRLWRNRYDAPLVARVVSIVRDRIGARRILDAGCGTGLFSIGLAAALPEVRIVGVDLSSGMLAVARSQAGERTLDNTTFSRADVASLPFGERSFDVVVAAGLFPNVNDHLAVLRELGRVASPEARLIIVEFDRAAMGPALRLFFGVMILGYRSISFIFRRFRFADSWNIRSSTIDRETFEGVVARAGLHVVSVDALEGHLILELAKGTPS